MHRKSLMLLFLLLPCIHLSATVIHVPGDYGTIQAGIDAASYGDTVLVAPATYYENLMMADGVSLIGSGMDNTIIDGGYADDVIKCISINEFIIEGFTIQKSNQGGSTPGNVGVFINPHSSAGIKAVRYCHIKNNGKGIDLWNDFGGILYVAYNIISENIYDGFSPYLGTVYLSNNTIVRNGRDGYTDWSGGGTVFITNNIIAENGRFGIFKHRDTPVFVSYNDVWNNVQGDYYQGYAGDPWPFEPNPGTGEINEDPLFLDIENDDYHLNALSPCIDAGDPGSPYDPDGTIADMGALYFDQMIDIDIEEILPADFVLFQNYPNPFNASTTIEFTLYEQSQVDLSLYNILGRKMFLLLNAVKPAGRNVVHFDASSLPSGTYFYRLRAGEFSETRKMILLK